MNNDQTGYYPDDTEVLPLKGDGPLAQALLKGVRQPTGDREQDTPWRDELVEARYWDWKVGRGK